MKKKLLAVLATGIIALSSCTNTIDLSLEEANAKLKEIAKELKSVDRPVKYQVKYDGKTNYYKNGEDAGVEESGEHYIFDAERLYAQGTSYSYKTGFRSDSKACIFYDEPNERFVCAEDTTKNDEVSKIYYVIKENISKENASEEFKAIDAYRDYVFYMVNLDEKHDYFDITILPNGTTLTFDCTTNGKPGCIKPNYHVWGETDSEGFDGYEKFTIKNYVLTNFESQYIRETSEGEGKFRSVTFKKCTSTLEAKGMEYNIPDLSLYTLEEW